MSDRRELDELDKLPEIPPELKNATNEDLFNVIVSEVLEYYQDNEEDLQGKSLDAIFSNYIDDNSDFLDILKNRLGNDINFNKIKDLYVRGNNTLEQALTRDSLKRLTRKDAVKSYIIIFENEINDILRPVGHDLVDFIQFIPANITTDSQIDELFRNVNDELFQKTNNLSNSDKESIKHTLITNDDILNQMEIDGVITSDEKAAIEYDTIDINIDFTDDIKNELRNIQETLFIASAANAFQDIANLKNKIDLSMDNMGNVGKIGDLIEGYKNLDILTIQNIWNDKLNGSLSTEQQEEMDEGLKGLTGDALLRKELKFKKKFVEERLQDIRNFIELVHSYGTATIPANPNLADILAGILLGTINNTEKQNILTKFVLEYMDSVSDFVEQNLSLNNAEKLAYGRMLYSLINPSSSSITINGKTVSIDRVIKFGEITDLNDLFNAVPDIDFTFKNNLDVFYDIFPNHFSKINVATSVGGTSSLEKISHFSEYKVHKNDGTSIDGYISESIEDGKIKLYDTPLVKGGSIIETINLSDINYIDLQGDDVLELNSRNDLGILARGLVGAIPNRKIDVAASRLGEISEKFEEKTKANIPGFKQERKSLEGDVKAGFEVGTILHFKGMNLPWPGIKNNWFYGEIVDIDEPLGEFRIKLRGGGLAGLEGESDEFTIPMSPEILSAIKYSNGGNVFRFKKMRNPDDLQDSFDNLEFKSDFSSLKTGASLWQKNIEIRNGKLHKKMADGSLEEVKYIGRVDDTNINNADLVKKKEPFSDKINCWSINLVGEKIILTHPEDSTFTKTIDLNTFFVIISQNGLFPWTDEEYNLNKKDVETLPKDRGPGLRFTSFKSVSMSFKQLKDNYSYYRREKQELQAAQMYAGLTKLLPNTGVLGDMKMEAVGEKDSRIWKRIENAKARLDRSGEGKGKNHGKVAAGIIEREIFTKAAKGKKLNYDMRLKAAGYLLYSIESGGSPYFRKLADYEGKGYWVRALFGESHYKKYLQTVSILQNRLRQDPSNEGLRQDLAKSEIWYIKAIGSAADFYSANFAGALEGAYVSNVESNSKVEETYESESSRGNYYANKDPMNGYMFSNMPSKTLGTLKAMSQAVGSYDQYVDFYKVVMNFVLTGYLYNNFPSSFKSQFEKLCRTYGIPIGLSPASPDSLEKMLIVLDYVAKKKGIRPGGKTTFTEYLYDTTNPSNIDLFSLNTASQRKRIVSKMDEVWSMYGADIVNSLDYSDTDLLKYNSDDSATPREKTVIAEYFGKVNDSISEDFGYNDDLFKTSYAPYYQNGIFNIPSITFRKIALNLDDGDFDSHSGMAQGVWNSIENRLGGMKELMTDDDVYEFVLKKYLNWLGRYYKGEDELKFIKALESGHEEQLEKIIYDYNVSNYGSHGIIPYEMQKGLKQFVRTFKIRPNNIESVLTKVFGDVKLTNARGLSFDEELYEAA